MRNLKSLKLIAVLICLTVIVCSFAGCSTTVNLSFELNGGSNGEQEVPETYTTGTETKLPEPTMQYFDFLGWCLSSDLSGEAYKTLPADLVVDDYVEDGMKLYAKWQRKTNNIDYEIGEGAELENKVLVYEHGLVTALPTPTKDDYRFDDWLIDGTETIINSIGADQTGDLKLVAVWTQIKTNITFVVGDNATLSGAPAKFDTAKKFDLSTYIPVHNDGEGFGGWYLDEACTEQVTEIPRNTTEPVTVYAKWINADPVEGGFVPVQ